MKGKTAMTAQERTQASRKRKVEAGWQQVNVWLSPAARLALDESRKRLEWRGYKPTQNEIINQCIVGIHPLDNKDS